MIPALLERLEKQHGINILRAVESGSRAWGFPSPDSDYDVRFFYQCPLESYLTLYRRPDVIELMLPVPEGQPLDVVGWDISKALPLIAQGNVTAREWLESPVVYQDVPRPTALLRSFAEESFSPWVAWKSYQSMGRKALLEYQKSGRLKKFLYALRCALELQALRVNPEKMAPMSMGELLQLDLGLEETHRLKVAEVVAAKQWAAESQAAGAGRGVPEELETLVEGILARATPEFTSLSVREGDLRARSNEVFLTLLRGKA